MNKTLEELRAMLGKEVRVVLEFDKGVVAEGKLLSFDEGGGFVLLDDMGFRHFCWPMLEIEEVK
jgi:hypothetical protein